MSREYDMKKTTYHVGTQTKILSSPLPLLQPKKYTSKQPLIV